jgi:hypothetical protein
VERHGCGTDWESMLSPPSVILIREWEAQTSGSGCCGRLEGDFLPCGDSQPVAAERRAVMERMGPLYRTLRERFGESIDLDVVDPRNATLFFMLIRDFWTFRVGLGQAIRTLARIPIQAVVVNGRLVARGEWPDAEDVVAIIERSVATSGVS